YGRCGWRQACGCRECRRQAGCGSGTTLCSVALSGPVGFAGVGSMVAAGDSLAGAVGAEDVSVEACPAGGAPVGAAAKFPPFAKTLKRAARITAKAVPAKTRSQRGPFIPRRSPRQAQLQRISEAGAVCASDARRQKIWAILEHGRAV